MAEKQGKQMNASLKPVPMKLFAAWEVDRTSPNCIPRLCNLTLTRLVLLKPLGGEINSIIIAVKMQSSKRTLRSNEVSIPVSGLLDTELDLTFSLQYPHFLKRNGNYLHIMLQRRKRYKNRAILGFKTLAAGIINMAEVLQKPMDRELDLMTNLKEKGEIVSRVTMLALSSQPVDHEEPERQKLSLFPLTAGDERNDNYSDEDEEFSSQEEGSDSEPTLEQAKGRLQTNVAERRRSHLQKTLSDKLFHGSVEDRPDPIQRNIKQKFIALLRKFRVPEAEYQEDLEHELISQNPQEIEDLLFDEMDDLTDSGPEADDVSITSTPKPSLRPFFSTTTLVDPEIDKNNLDKYSDESLKRDSDSHQDTGTDPEVGEPTIGGGGAGAPAISPPRGGSIDLPFLGLSHPPEKKLPLGQSLSASTEKRPKLFTRDRHHPPSSKEKRSSSMKEMSAKDKVLVERTNSYKDIESSPRKTVVDQLGRIFPSEDSIPEHLFLVSAVDPLGQTLAQMLQDKQQSVLTTSTGSDLRACVTCLVNKIQKFCNCNNRAPPTIRIGVVGQDCFLNLLLRLYVENFSSKPPEWQTYIRFHIVPLGSSLVAKYLGQMDSSYGSSLGDLSWKDLSDRTSGEMSPLSELQELVSRVMNYVLTAMVVFQLPIAEAMVTYKEKSSDDESSQVFIPFITDVKVGVMEGVSSQSVEEESGINHLIIPGSSPPPSSQMEKIPRENVTPPSSPSITSSLLPSSLNNSTGISGNSPLVPSGEPMDLQVEYWTLGSKCDLGKKPESSKFTLKTTFRTLQISRLPCSGETSAATLTFNYLVKEKKQKIMRLGKKKEKDKESESRLQTVEGINRLICSCKNPQAPLKVVIDGVEWTGVKFFQLTSQWQTHIRYFPVALYHHPDQIA